MSEIFGNFVEMDNSQDYLTMNFSPTLLSVRHRWRSNGMTADFLADYWSALFSKFSSPHPDKQVEIRYAVNYITNELLENAMKFNYLPSESPVSASLFPSGDEVKFYVTNRVDPEKIGQFQYFIRKLLTEDLDELYIRQIRDNTENGTDSISRLGFLTILNDYKSDLAWTFETVRGKPVKNMVTTMARIVYHDLVGGE